MSDPDKNALQNLTREILSAMEFLDGPGGQWLWPGPPTREQYASMAAAQVYWHLNYRQTTSTQ